VAARIRPARPYGWVPWVVGFLVLAVVAIFTFASFFGKFFLFVALFSLVRAWLILRDNRRSRA
jgi:4-hydroxybenzoate polyprenyltransferase